MVQRGHGRRAAELLPRHARAARRRRRSDVRSAAGRAGRPVAILQDLPGPKLRIGKLDDDVAELKPGDVVTFLCGDDGGRDGDAQQHDDLLGRPARRGRPRRGPLPRRRRRAAAHRGRARRRARARRARRDRRRGRLAPGRERPGRGRRAARGPRGGPRAPRGRHAHGRRHGRALVRPPARGRQHVREHTRVPLIAKFEKPQAVERAEEILKASDCIMVARGDLGIELPIEEVPIVQKKLLALAGALRAPGDHRDADARLDGHLEPPDARRGRRRRQRDPRRHRRGDALARRPRSAPHPSARSR